jgi:uncharacterized membrane protein YdbT with pleckstrin-like domain
MVDINKIINLKENERILLVVRRYWLTLLPIVFRRILFLFLFLILGFWFWGWELFTSFYPALLFFGILVFVLVSLVYEWLIWYQDIYIITNKRIINIQRNSLFSTTISEAGLDKIQDVTFKIEGVFQTFFNYGTVMVQTASSIGVLNLEDVENPSLLVEKIREACEIFEEEEKTTVTVGDLLKAIEEEKKKAKENKKNSPKE